MKKKTKNTEKTEESRKPVPDRKFGRDDNSILIGSKPFMNYVFGVQSQFGKNNEVIIKARGKFISRAVDVAEVVRKKFMENIKLKDIKINSEPFKNKEGKDINVSSMEITLCR